jgi:hypothetical protein
MRASIVDRVRGRSTPMRAGRPASFVDSAPEPFVDDERERVNESLSRWWVLLMVAVLLLLLAFVVHVSK